MTNEERKAALEAIIYAADEPVSVEQLATALGEAKPAVQVALDELVASYAVEERGIEIRAVAGGYKMYTKPQHHEVVRRFIRSLRPPLRLTMPALETLAVIAYKQPATSPEIQEIRGGFGLNDLEELPSLKEFEALAREALGDEGIAPAEGEAVAAGGSESVDSPGSAASPMPEEGGGEERKAAAVGE